MPAARAWTAAAMLHNRATPSVRAPAMTETPAPPVSEDAPALYRLLAQDAPAGSALTTLHIGGSHTTLASGEAGSAPLLQRTLDMGARVTAATRFAQDTPRSDELQAAAEAALALFAPLRERLAPGSTLYTADTGVRRIALAAGLPAQPEMELALADVEALFERLLGHRPPEGGDDAPQLPPEGRFAAALAILRACLLGLGFERICIRSEALA